MKNLTGKLFKTCAFASAAVPSIAFAGTPIVIVGPVGASGGAQVPTMTSSLLIALAVLLAVVAIRFLKQKGLQQKVMSLLVLGSGLVVGAVGVQDSLATSVTVSVESSACTGSTVPLDPSRGDGFDSSAELFNQCSSASIQVIAYQGYPCPPEQLIDQGAGPGAVIAAGDSALLSYCPSVPD